MPGLPSCRQRSAQRALGRPRRQGGPVRSRARGLPAGELLPLDLILLATQSGSPVVAGVLGCGQRFRSSFFKTYLAEGVGFGPTDLLAQVRRFKAAPNRPGSGTPPSIVEGRDLRRGLSHSPLSHLRQAEYVRPSPVENSASDPSAKAADERCLLHLDSVL